MKVALETSYVDPANGIDAEPGDTIELPDDVAVTLIERGSASAVAEAPATKRTTRTKSAPEKRGK